jgi:hypothetical protein
MKPSASDFALKTEQRRRIAGHFFWQEFEFDKTVKARILGLVDHAHAATTNLLDDPVVLWPIVRRCVAFGSLHLTDAAFPS